MKYTVWLIGKIKIVFSHRNRIAQSDSLKKPIHIPFREVSLTLMYLRLYLWWSFHTIDSPRR